MGGDQKDAIVIGAGMIGVCSAWHLQKSGYKVTIVDRKAPGEETSWGNGGLIQRCCVFPHPFPHNGIMEMLSIASNTRTDVRYTFRGIWESLMPIAKYWYYSRPQRYDQICREFETLIRHSVTEHDELIAATKSEKLVRRRGYIEYYPSQDKSFAEAKASEYGRRGVRAVALTPEETHKLEPSVDVTKLGAMVHFVDDVQCIDPGELVKVYANHVVRRGGTAVQANVLAVKPPVDGDKKYTVETDCGPLKAETVVVATGPWSAEFLKPLGYSFPLQPLRGYNAHFKLGDGAVLNSCLIDGESGYLFGPMCGAVRITTGGEVAAVSDACHEGQLRESEKLCRQVFPMGEQVGKVWLGHRPCMPDMKPVMGEAPRHPGLWLNFGHAHSGFTLGPICGRVLSEMMTGEKPFVDPTPFAPARFL